MCAAIGAALAATVPAGASAPRPGELDRAFGVNGRVTTPFDAFKTNSAVVADGLVGPDGKLIAVANTDISHGGELALVRFEPDGLLDPSFGTGGTVLINPGGDIHAAAVVLEPDGRILALGNLTAGPGTVVTLFRFNPDGSLDASFGSGGIATGPALSGESLALQPDGKIIVAGEATGAFGLARFNSDGTPDPSFGVDGVVSGPSGAASDVAVEPDGRIVAVGIAPGGPGAPTRLAAARYEADGSPDPSFGSDGTVSTDVGGGVDRGIPALVVQPDGRVVVGASNFLGYAVVVRYDQDGSLDASFGDGGVAVPGIPAASRRPFSLPVHQPVALEPDGEIDLATNDGAALEVARLEGNGTLDPSFGTNGVAAATLAPNTTAVTALGRDPTGRPVVIGGAYRVIPGSPGGNVGPSVAFSEYGIARFTASGATDPSFAEDGTATADAGTEKVSGDAGAEAVVVEPGGKIVLVGDSWAGSGAGFPHSPALARYRPSGSLDPTFGDGGTMLTERDAGGVAFSERPVAALVAGHGKIIVVGTESRTAGLEAPAPPRIALLRYRSDGSLDHSFGEGRLVTDFAGTAVAAVRQPNAKIVVLGSNLRGALVARYRPNGSLDRTFGHRGVVEITRRLFTSPRQLLLQTHGRIVLSSSEGLARLKRTGAIDRSFGHRGFEKVIAGGAEDLTQLLRAGRGRLLLTGRSGARLALLRFRTNGTPDRSFGARGLRVPHVVTFPGQPAAVEPDGKIILSGEESRHVVLTRLDRSGSRDPTFGDNGRVVVPMRGFVRRIVPIGGHRLLVAGEGPGEVGGSSTRSGFMLARLHR